MGNKLVAKISKANDSNKITGKESHNLRLYYKKGDKAFDKRMHPENEHMNEYSGAVGKGELLKAVNRFVDDKNKELKANGFRKIRKDANKVFELIVSSGPEFFKVHDDSKFYDDVDDFLKTHFSEDCIAARYIHRDEKTSHAHYMVYPTTSLDKGGINYNKFFGTKGLCSKFQQDIYDYMVYEKGYAFDERTRKIDKQITYKSNLEWSESVDRAREEVNWMNDKDLREYAVKGVLLEEKVDKLEAHNVKLRNGIVALAESQERYENKYNDLKAGIMEMPGISQEYVDNLEYDGRLARKELEQQEQFDNETSVDTGIDKSKTFDNELEL